MKRLIITFVLLISVIVLTGCGEKKTMKSAKTGLSSAFSCDMKLLYDDSEFCGKITRSGTGLWNIEFTAPETLAGVKLSFINDDVTASYKGLDFTIPKKAMPVKSIISNLISAVDELAGSEEMQCVTNDGEIIVEGELEQGEYKLVMDEKSGCVKSFEMKNIKAYLTFENVSDNVSDASMPVTSEATMSTVTSVS